MTILSLDVSIEHSILPRRKSFMRDYDPDLPLVALHIPKTAGTSVSDVFRAWFGRGLLPHYYDHGMPPRYDLANLHSRDTPVVVYGHFNRDRGFGVPDYYPDVRQFVTILRDPFERMLSGYFYGKKVGRRPRGWHEDEAFTLRAFAMSRQFGFLRQFPCEVTRENYRDVIDSRFVEIGLSERLDESLGRMAAKLGRSYTPGSVPKLNATERDEDIPAGLREEFMQTVPLEVAVYDYVRAMYE